MPKGGNISDNPEVKPYNNIPSIQQTNTIPIIHQAPHIAAPSTQRIAHPQVIQQIHPTNAIPNPNIQNMSVQQNYYHQPQFNQFNSSRVPMNDAIAFTSMIDSNIGGKLNDLLPDTTSYNYQVAVAAGQPQHTFEPAPIPHDIQSSFRGFQNDQIYGNQLNNNQRAIQHQFSQIASHNYPRQTISQPAYFPSDPESSPEVPKTNTFEIGERSASFHSTPSNMNYKPNLGFYQSPTIKSDLDSNYAGSPSLCDQGFNGVAGNMSYYPQPQLPYPIRDHNSSTSSNSNTAISSKPSFSMSISSANSTLGQSRNGSIESFNSKASPRSYKAKKPKKPINLRGGTCKVCGKVIKRDMTRHMRIHEEVSRFRCVYPRGSCIHKTGFFNRQYDFKKHLLHFHFDFDDSSVKKLYSLNEKLPHWGTCYCGLRFTGGEWLQSHILTNEKDQLCPHLARLKEKDLREQRGNHDHKIDELDDEESPENESDKSETNHEHSHYHGHSDSSFNE